MTASRLCLALDVSTTEEAVAWTRRFAGRIGVFKIGLQLFVAQGPGIVAAIRAAGARRVFLDLKLHDIPNTVAGAVRSAADLGVDLLTVHCSGGPRMLAAAQGAAGSMDLLGVTLLTSLDDAELAAIGIDQASTTLVESRAHLAVAAGLSGIVCSAHEVARLRANHPTAQLVVPGVRLLGATIGDQKRVATPQMALEAGSSLLVLGRTVRDAPNPEAALARVEAAVVAANGELS